MDRFLNELARADSAISTGGSFLGSMGPRDSLVIVEPRE
jgi:hypothetical protein